MLEHYISVGQQRMRCGYTTGTCAAGAARAARPCENPREGEACSPSLSLREEKR